MNCKIGFMSCVVLTSIVILFLLVSGIVEAQKAQCIGTCDVLFDCSFACANKGYSHGHFVFYRSPNECCCNN
ncbi:PREDICTED: putative defensin-like protein 73 [Camelina sativa]|uniref:Defensin-like protein 73 n=1 Tax=Camelina sativa TaxID=90675 RepID=A0ABM1R0A8_CAMSA|nr:PREDICTED: putative defensin-like protein 73 [Camelina sativa]